MNKEGFLIYKSFYEPIKGLSNEDAGRLFKALFEYQINGEILEEQGMVKMAFEFFKNQFDLDNKKYEKIVMRNKANGKKGGRPKKQTQENQKNPVGYLGTQETQINPENPTEPKKADKDKDKEKEKEKDNNNELSSLFIFLEDVLKKRQPEKHLLKNQEKMDAVAEYYTTIQKPDDFAEYKKAVIRGFKGIIDWDVIETMQKVKNHILNAKEARARALEKQKEKQIDDLEKIMTEKIFKYSLEQFETMDMEKRADIRVLALSRVQSQANNQLNLKANHFLVDREISNYLFENKILDKEKIKERFLNEIKS